MSLLKTFVNLDFWSTSRLVPRAAITRLMYYVTRIHHPRFLVRAMVGFWIRTYRMDLSDYVVPEGGFRDFNAFHLRELLPGRREVADAEVVCPCDGVVTAVGPIELDRSLKIKGHPYTLEELVTNNRDDDAFATGALAAFEGGSFISLYLAVDGYHWWHSPVAGTVQHTLVHDGTLISVTEKALRLVAKLFAKNHRMVEFIRCGDGSRIAVISVAATSVGMLLSTYERNARGSTDVEVDVARGEKLGGFAFGSAIVVLLPPGFQLDGGLEPGAFCRMGAAIARV